MQQSNNRHGTGKMGGSVLVRTVCATALLSCVLTLESVAMRPLCRATVNAEDREAIEDGTLPPLRGIRFRLSRPGVDSQEDGSQALAGIDRNGVVFTYQEGLDSLNLDDGDTVRLEASVGLARHQNPCWEGSIEIPVPKSETPGQDLPVLTLRRSEHTPKRLRCVVSLPDGTRIPKRLLTLTLRRKGADPSTYEPYFYPVADGVGQIWMPGTVLDDAFEIHIDRSSFVSWEPGNVPLRNPYYEFVPSEVTDGVIEYRLDPVPASVEVVVSGSRENLDAFMDNGIMAIYQYTPPEGFFTGGKPRWHGERMWTGNSRRTLENGVLVEKQWKETRSVWYEWTRVLSGDRRRSRRKSHEKHKHDDSPARTKEGEIVCRFYSVPEGKYWLTVSSRKLTVSPRILTVPAPDEGTLHVEAVVTKKQPPERVQLTGRVVDREGRPVPRAYVHFSNAEADYLHREMCGEKGTFSDNDAPAKDIAVHVKKRGYASLKRKLSKEEISGGPIVLQFHRLPRVIGRVTDDKGKPVKEAMVSLLKLHAGKTNASPAGIIDNARADSKGRFELRAKGGEGAYSLVARTPLMTGPLACEKVIVQGKETTADLNLPPDRFVTIEINTEKKADSARSVPKGTYSVHVYRKDCSPLAVCAAGDLNKKGRIDVSLADGEYAVILFIEQNQTGEKHGVPKGITPVPEYSALPPKSFTVTGKKKDARVMIPVPADWKEKTVYTGQLNPKSLTSLWYSEQCKWWMPPE